MKLSMRPSWTPLYKIFAAIVWAADLFFAYGGIIFGSSGLKDSGGYQFTWFILVLESNYNKSTGKYELSFHIGAFIIGTLIAIAVAAIPFIIKKIENNNAEGCNLTLEEDQLVGTRKSLLSTKQIKMPIEKLDNVFTSCGIFDKLRGGETLSVHSNSGAVKFFYVQNASDFAAAAVAQIEKYKKSVQTAPESQKVDQSVSGQLAELKSLLDSGMITQEDFEQKKKQLLGL